MVVSVVRMRKPKYEYDDKYLWIYYEPYKCMIMIESYNQYLIRWNFRR